MGLKSLGMSYLALLVNQETVTRRKRKRSNPRVIAQARDLPFSSSSPGTELCPSWGFSSERRYQSCLQPH